MFILDDLLLAPIHGIRFIANKIYEVVDQEMNDESHIKQQLLELQMQIELEEISEQEYEEREAELFARLRDIKERKFETRDEVHTANSSLVVETTAREDDEARPEDHRDRA